MIITKIFTVDQVEAGEVKDIYEFLRKSDVFEVPGTKCELKLTLTLDDIMDLNTQKEIEDFIKNNY